MKKKLLISLFLITIIFVSSLAAVQVNAKSLITDVPVYSYQTFEKQMSTVAGNTSIITIGDCDFNLSEVKVSTNSVIPKSLTAKGKNDLTNICIVDSSSLTSEICKDISKLLDKGYLVYFYNPIGHVTEVEKYFSVEYDKTDDAYKSTLYALGLSMDADENLVLTEVVCAPDASKEETNEAVLFDAYKYRNTRYMVTEQKENLSTFNTYLNAKASSYGFDIDSDWDLTKSWYRAVTSASGGVMTTWRSGWYTNYYGHDYYASLIKVETDPKTGRAADTVWIKNDVDYYDSDIELFDYAPKSDPNQNPAEFSLGVNSSGEVSFGISAPIASLVITNNSSSSQDLFSVKYSSGFAYSFNTQVYYGATISEDTDNSGQMKSRYYCKSRYRLVYPSIFYSNAVYGWKYFTIKDS